MTIESFGKRWMAAPHGGKGVIIKEMMAFYGWSKQTCHDKLTKAGFTSGKAKRSDAGKSKLNYEQLHLIASMLQEGRRENGKQQLSIPECLFQLRLNGYDIDVSERTVQRRLKELGLDVKSQKLRKVHGRMRSKHPNHVWQIDPSYCTIYYLPSGEQRIIADSEDYKNKPELHAKLLKEKRKVWRYVVTDHYSGYTYVRYYQATGENQENLYDFFLHAAMKKPNCPFHGVPQILMMDKGSANISNAMLAALTALGVEVRTHAAGAANVKGTVENGNNRTECSFETHLKFDPLHSIDEMNKVAEAYFIGYNANAFYNKYKRDHRMKRNGKRLVREELWLDITEQQLRLLPDLVDCRRLLLKPAEERTVDIYGCISVERHTFNKVGGIYQVAHLGLNPSNKVMVQCLAYDGPAILVHYEDYKGNRHTVRIAEPLKMDTAGQITSAAVIGEEYKSAADSPAERNRKQLEKLAHPEGKKKNATPFAHLNDGQGLQTHEAIIAAVDEYSEKNLTVPKRGQQVSLGQVEVYELDYSLPEALMQLKKRLEAEGYEYSSSYINLVKRCVKGGKINEKQLEGIYESIIQEDGYEDIKEA